jgi:hypothetical protein
MTLEVIKNQFTKGGTGLTDGSLAKVLVELQGLNVSVVAGAAAGTAMALAAIRPEDTILSAVVTTDAAAAAVVDDKANITIQSTVAFGTITVSGNPVANETVTVNGVVYTWKADPAGNREVLLTAGNNTAMAASLAAAINGYEGRYEAQLNGDGWRTPAVVATSALGVVTVTSVADGTAGNAITLTEASTNVAVTGAGTLTGGSATGSLKSTTDLTGKTLTVYWFNKR